MAFWMNCETARWIWAGPAWPKSQAAGGDHPPVPEQRQRGGRHQEGVCGDRQALLCRAGHGPEAAYVSLCEKITAAKINIEENKARIAELKAESGVSDADVPPGEDRRAP